MASNLRRSRNTFSQRFLYTEDTLEDSRRQGLSRDAIATNIAKAPVVGPTDPVTGQFWYDTTVDYKRLKVWNGTAWDVIGEESAYSDTAPLGPQPGAMWSDTATGNLQLKVWNGLAWCIVGGDMPRFFLRSGLVLLLDDDIPGCPEWDTADWDTDGFLSLDSKSITIPPGYGGVYQFSYAIIYPTDASAYRRNTWIDINEDENAYPAEQYGRRYAPIAIDNTEVTAIMQGSDTVEVHEGDVVRVKVSQSSGVQKAVNPANRQDIVSFNGVMISHIP